MSRLFRLLERIATALEYIAEQSEITTTHKDHPRFEDDPYHPRYSADHIILYYDDLARC